MDKNRKIILEAAIEVIEKEGFHKFTLQKVAKTAQLTLEQVKSYFHANSLIKEALQQSINEGFVNNLNESKKNYLHKPEEFLQDIFKKTVLGMINYPRLTKSHFYTSFVHNDKENISEKLMKQFINNTFEVIRSDLISSTEEKVLRRLEQAFASLLFASMFLNIFKTADIDVWIRDLSSYVLDNSLNNAATKK